MGVKSGESSAASASSSGRSTDTAQAEPDRGSIEDLETGAAGTFGAGSAGGFGDGGAAPSAGGAKGEAEIYTGENIYD